MKMFCYFICFVLMTSFSLNNGNWGYGISKRKLIQTMNVQLIQNLNVLDIT